VTAPDELREAAARLRTARFTGAATMTPAVAGLIAAREPLAQWLEAEAFQALHNGQSPNHHHALAVARQILGSQP
jgi:hypothetical protein